MLFVGDVVGPRAVEWLAARLPELICEHAVDLTIVDAENCGPDAASMSLVGVERLLDAGAAVITGGNHAFDGPQFAEVLAHERVLRPLNVSPQAPGRGALSLPVAGQKVCVVVLADRLALDDAPPVGRMTLAPYAALRGLPACDADATIVEMHALSVTEKQGLAHACDGEVAAVLGTHTHEPTLPLRVLPRGTALVTDVGMTGPDDGPQGMHPVAVAARVRMQAPGDSAPVGPAEGEIVLGAVLLEIAGGLTRGLRRL